MEIVTGCTGEIHVTPIDDAVRNANTGYYSDKVVFSVFRNFEAQIITANQVRIYGGYGMNQGRIFKIDRSAFDNATIESESITAKRKDLIVARYQFDTNTNTEDITLEVIKGTAGDNYTTPAIEEGDINSGATIDDFPLYAVYVDGNTIDHIEPLFTPLPDGGRLGEVQQTLNDHMENTTNPHRITWEIASALESLSVSDTLAVTFGKIAKAVASLIAHIANTSNPHNVSASQLGGVLPISKGGTGATTAAGALENLGVPSDVANAATKQYAISVANNAAGEALTAIMDGNSPTGNVSVAHGGTGKSSVTSGSVLVGNGTGAMVEKSIDSAPTANSDNLITSGAVAELKQSFTDGCNAIANALIAKGVTPTKTGENYTPDEFITAINTLLAKRKRNVSYSLTDTSTKTGSSGGYDTWKRTVTVVVGGVTKTFTGTVTVASGAVGAGGAVVSGTWTQNV